MDYLDKPDAPRHLSTASDLPVPISSVSQVGCTPLEQPNVLSASNEIPKNIWLQSRSPAPNTPDLDSATVDLIRRVQPYTMTSPESIAALRNAVQYVVNSNILGDIIECGVWKGGSTMTVASTLRELGARRRLHLFDSFEGMTVTTDVDRNIYGESAAKLMTDKQGVWARSTLDEVKNAMRSVGYDESLIDYIKGPVEQTIPQNAPSTISLLRLDTDWYESTKHELHHLFPRLSVGGVLIIDDYGHWQGSRRAVNEYIAENRLRLLLNRIYSGRICVRLG
jgi:O-methyltransferase